ncbi:MAG: response regulator [Firmicutes bacterium]|nr:response regulator [Bacillota bacterium]
MANKILIVDDERDFVEINRATLESKGYKVVAAYNGKEGLEKAQPSGGKWIFRGR